MTLLTLLVFGMALAALVRTQQLRSDLDILRRQIDAMQSVKRPRPAAAIETAGIAGAPSPKTTPATHAPPLATRQLAAANRTSTKSSEIERLLATRWGIWLGAVALLFAGAFLVRYAADNGLLGPTTRCITAAALGLALIGAAEAAKRWTPSGAAILWTAGGKLPQEYGPTALASGGLATLFGAAYSAGPGYGLIGPIPSFAALATIGISGLALSLRHGPLVTAVGIGCAMGTPALIDVTAPSRAILFTYLAIVTATAAAVMSRTGWTWLGRAAAGGGTAWVLIAGGMPDPWPAAVFMPVATTLLIMPPLQAMPATASRWLAWITIGLFGTAGIIVGATMTPAGTWTVLGTLMLSPLACARGNRDAEMDRLPWFAAALGCMALAAWDLAQNPMGPWQQAAAPILQACAAGLALFCWGCGHAVSHQAKHPERWAALPAGVPVAALAIVHLRTSNDAEPLFWAWLALATTTWSAIAAGLELAMGGPPAGTDPEEDGRSRRVAGVHAAGAAAGLGLACAFLLGGDWLTLSIALFPPALAWIAELFGLAALRKVAIVAAGIVIVRLIDKAGMLWTPEHGAEAAIRTPVAYAISMVSFAFAAMRFRRTREDLTVTVLESGAWALGTAAALLELRQLSMGEGNIVSWFASACLWTTGLACIATAARWLDAHNHRRVTGYAWRIEGGAALCLGIGLLIANPAFTAEIAPGVTVFNALLAGYLVPAALAGQACRSKPALGTGTRRAMGAYAGIAAWAWITLEVRRVAHGNQMGLFDAPIWNSESWAYSGAWLAYAGALMAGRIVGKQRSLRLAGLGVATATSAKVFLLDMAGLTGLWRVASFLGLGLTLIALGMAHARFVGKEEGIPGADYRIRTKR
jgi:uncharacterized membrane protein